jgi:hypothetical protein
MRLTLLPDAFTEEGSANFRDFAPLIYLAFGIAALAYS